MPARFLFSPKFQRPIQEQNCPKTGQNCTLTGQICTLTGQICTLTGQICTLIGQICTLIGQICAISPRAKPQFPYKATRFFGSQVPSGRMRRFLCLPVC